MVRTTLNGMVEIILPKHRAEREEWHTPEGWERERMASMVLNLNSNDIVYYIGAEEGEFPALIQMWGAKVVLFEPNPKVWSTIKAIWEANKLEFPCGIVPAFASDKDRLATNVQEDMRVGDDGWPRCANYDIEAAHGFKELDKESKSYDQVKIDSVVEATGTIPTALSIDVEGSEGRVLRGAEKTLKKYHPKIWLSGHPEFLIQQYGENLRELRGWIKDIGYKEELLDYDHEVHLYYHE